MRRPGLPDIQRMKRGAPRYKQQPAPGWRHAAAGTNDKKIESKRKKYRAEPTTKKTMVGVVVGDGGGGGGNGIQWIWKATILFAVVSARFWET